MSINILMPALSPTMTEGKLAKWHVKVGDTVKSGQVVCEIETDKATMEVEAVDEGKVGQILVEEGTEGVAVNAVIAVLLEEGETEVAKSAAPAAEKPAPKAEQKPAEKPAEKPASPAAAPAPAAEAAAPAASSGGTRIFASPLAKRIAAEKGIDLAGLKGSGPNGRIVKADVENAKPGAAPAAAAQAPKAAAKAPAPPAGGQPVFVAPGDSRVPHTSIRKVIARRMLESKQTVPHFYLTVDFEIDALLTARTAINAVVEKKGTKVSVNDMVIKACAKALRDHPECNASWTEDEMIQYGAVDISVAVATDRGLITPIVRNADMKGLAQISIEMKDLASRAKSGKLKLEEFQGGGFTISNLGMFGIRDFGAIINTPQAMILAVGAGEERVVVRKGEMVIRNIMSCTLAVDHRVVDGALGAQFLQTLKAYIEQPAAMLA
ncbi:pyruvate dehydrogenase complex dihydrolipoamide acetyltransferase [Reyranella sp.]|jgi:pyruvate dehydrogenase E2 component (dihydrolipoamide acetyltransferase)|uniref:pyruvate dehydrogenase complex dihydrolipoamide acetyltransferase n=1 Tax=Reyranella sp. TaxID=1929291 RepID=UPI000BC8F15B|nr:pyruvate dehydrogenase complex dihydrolipoamide acetyltransferase [Reyranella sp.]OYY45853.1 MAG: pyruvate dehydrogenase complex dihydrolipoamide acetyltransferase [Rhodospirillales bacterium 35-66-84]OYZ96234.1 MAG: pyruvate dehydrogenase complex dihydrolipoamide acetyltransferase [Rhodospirillales bacterium 24-66-33]OZB28604.1 MAG: pyruvate dehydrogenase complex dihydrolipoamide acetyltransferase [Rhodospirillales bacterium 39-66-50]HQS14173.1 pyruvate dehydrogenase complex dihydrolipoamid